MTQEPKITMPAKKIKTTWSDVAGHLGVTTSAIHNWRKEKADCPKTKDFNEWTAWAQNRAAGQTHGGGRLLVQGREYTAADIHDLKAKLTGEQTRKERALADLRELELQQKRDSLVPESQLAEVIIKTLTPLRRLIDALPRAIASQANPGNPNIAELAIRNGLDDRVFGEIEKILEEYE